jgi:hypothetical protein
MREEEEQSIQEDGRVRGMRYKDVLMNCHEMVA